jgi:TRAP-type C4-dicarboxylate transport system permease small subunit
MIRRVLDRVFAASGVVAVAFLMLIAILTIGQAGARLFGTMIPSADDFAGFCMAGAVFIGLAHTLRAGAHIRVLVVLSQLGARARRVAEAVCCLTGTAVVAVLVWYTVDMILVTRELGEFTLGLVPIPKWIPMLLMLVGLAVFLLALLDELARVIAGRQPLYAEREESSESLPVSAE